MTYLFELICFSVFRFLRVHLRFAVILYLNLSLAIKEIEPRSPKDTKRLSWFQNASAESAFSNLI